jgi:hypothetical protein
MFLKRNLPQTLPIQMMVAYYANSKNANKLSP